MSQQPMRLKAEWAIDSEAMRARGIIVLVKSNQLVKKISRLKIFRKLIEARLQSFLPPKHYKYGGCFSLLVGYNIQPTRILLKSSHLKKSIPSRDGIVAIALTPPTYVDRVQCRNHGHECRLSWLLILYSTLRGFSPGSPVSPSPKNQHFQIPILLNAGPP